MPKKTKVNSSGGPNIPFSGKKTLVIMGTHPASLKSFDWNRTDCEIWMFNEAPNAKDPKGNLLYPKSDAVFQLHNEAIWKNPKNRVDIDHYKWLSSGKTPTVYMQEVYKEVPKSVRYPIEKVLSLTDNVRIVFNGKEKGFKYFSSSPEFAFALVAKLWKEGKRYEKVEVWGIELEMESEYIYQRTGFAFWIGYLAALGVKVYLHNLIFDIPMYGYESDVVVPSKYIEKRIADLNAQLGTDKDRYNQEAKNFLENLSGLLYKNTIVEIQNELNSITKSGEVAGIINGKIKESMRYLEKAKEMEKTAKISVFSPGEFDGTRIEYQKQYVQVHAEAVGLDNQIGVLLKRLLNLKKGSQKRQRAIDEFGQMVAALMNKNMLLFHIVGGIQENQYYMNSVKLSFQKVKEESK